MRIVHPPGALWGCGSSGLEIGAGPLDGSVPFVFGVGLGAPFEMLAAFDLAHRVAGSLCRCGGLVQGGDGVGP